MFMSKKWHQLQVWINSLFSQGTISCIPGTSDMYPGCPFDPSKQNGTYMHQLTTIQAGIHAWKLLRLL